MIHPPNAVFTDPAVVSSGWPVHLTSDREGYKLNVEVDGLLGADGPVFLGGDTAALTVAV